MTWPGPLRLGRQPLGALLRAPGDMPLLNLTALSNPTVNDDASKGYGPGSAWVNTAAGTSFTCVDGTIGAAVWNADSGAATPHAHDWSEIAETPTTLAGYGITDGVTDAELAAAVTGLLEFKGALDCSADPDYPAALLGDSYVISVAGKIGGAAGVSVAVGDAIAAIADNAGGSQAAVGASWVVLDHSLEGCLLIVNNLSDLDDAATARSNLGLGTLATQSGTFSGTSSGTNTGDQTITLTSDVTGSGTGSFAATIALNAVTFAKMQNISSDRLMGRDTAGVGDPEELTVNGGLEFTGAGGIQRAALTGEVTAPAGSTVTTIAADAVTFAKMQNIATDKIVGRDTAGSGDPEELTVNGGLEFTGAGGIQRSALTGDVTAPAGSNTATIANDAVTFAKMQNIATDRLIGRDTSGSGDPEEIAVGDGLEFSGAGAIRTVKASNTETLTGTDAVKAVTPDALAALWEKGADVASAATISLGEGGYFHVTGTTTITDIDFATPKDGRMAVLVFDGVLTLTHHATTLQLPGGRNIVTAAGDRLCVVSDAGDNIIGLWFQRAAGRRVPLFWGGATFAGGDAGKHHTANGAANDNAGRSAVLGPLNRMGAGQAGRLEALWWDTASADGTTVYKINVNGVVVETVALTGATGIVTGLTAAYNEGDLVAVEYDAGTAPGQSQVKVFGAIP